MGIRTVFLGGDGWEVSMLKLAEGAAQGSYSSDHWHRESPDAVSRKIVAGYEAKYGQEDISAAFALAYDAVMVVASAVRDAGSPERSRIRAALAATRDFQGATGTITFDSRRDPVNKDVTILKFEKDKIVYVKSVKP